jgi:hypothetical protein
VISYKRIRRFDSLFGSPLVGLLLGVIVVWLMCCEAVKISARPHTSEFHQWNGELLSLYQVIPGDTFVISSMRMNGHPIESELLTNFPDEKPTPYDENPDYGTGYFGWLKFQIDSDRIGLITQTPSDYQASSVHLFVMNKNGKIDEPPVLLAESTGDHGYGLEVRSVFLKDKKGQVRILIERKSTQYDPEQEEISYEISIAYFLLDTYGRTMQSLETDDSYRTLFDVARILVRDSI